ncbi:MAG: Ferrochelatase, protoheme ferro-lyase [Ignavibacteriae bacterium]|nr:MAG: Ferrochelatase, protoheme ferro-lyase [Ignavibacteriota bacterium]
MNKEKIAVILFQLGGPDSINSVEEFLYNLFSDPDIFDFPFASLIRKPLAFLISSRRVRTVQHHYISIGGKSPILDITNQQAAELEKELKKSYDAKVFVAMRYFYPKIESVVEKLSKTNFDKHILLPLYPQYSKTTTGSSLKEWERQCRKQKFLPKNQKIINNFYDNELYIEAIVEQINNTLSKFKVNHEDIMIVFSAHGVPLNLIENGDPYKEEIEKTVNYVIQKGMWKSEHILCYQSKVGPLKWLEPSLIDTVTKLVTEGKKNLLIVPISFVSEHLETLYEINIQVRQLANELGVEQYEMMPALNTHPKFIEALKNLVIKSCQ